MDKKTTNKVEWHNDGGLLTKKVVKWNESRTDLIETGEEIDVQAEMNARAKGTTVYELIASCGGFENLVAVLPQGNGSFGDYSEIPEFSHEMRELSAKVAQLEKENLEAKEKENINIEEKDPVAEMSKEIESLKAELASIKGVKNE